MFSVLFLKRTSNSSPHSSQQSADRQSKMMSNTRASQHSENSQKSSAVA